MANGNLAGGDGTIEKPYLIEDAFDLDIIRNGLDKHYKLINNVDLNISPYNEGEGWIPIENFNGSLNGDGYVVKNLFIESTSDYCGFFGGYNTNSYTVKNIGFADIYFISSGIWDHGILGGRLGGNCLFENCFTTGYISCTKESNYDRVGGIIGSVIGRGTITINNCYSLCEIVKGSVKGGIVGAMWGGNLVIKNTYYAGILHATGTIDNIIGASNEGTKIITNNCFWDMDVSQVKTSIYGTGLTTQEMQNPQNLIDAGWDKEMTIDEYGNEVFIWILEEDKYPKLWFEVEIKVLIRFNDKYHTFEGGEFIEVEPTGGNFEEFSVNLMALLTPNSQGIKPLMTLENPEIVLLTDKENPMLYIKGSRDLRPLMESNDPKILIHSEVEPEISVTFLPEPQLIIPTGDIVLRMLDKIYEFTIHSNKNHGATVKIIFSVDSGISWMTYNIATEEFEEIDIGRIENVKEGGIDPDVFNAIGEKWNKVVVNNKIRFAYYLEINSMNDIAEVDQLEIKMDMYGRWKKAGCTDYSYEYDNEHIYISFFKNGSYKINYQG